MTVPASRIRASNENPVKPEGGHVLYWMVMYRRAGWNFALQRAAEWARKLGKPLVVLEALRCDYPHASDRLHRFILDGMRDNEAAFRARGVVYLPYVERAPGEGKGLLAALCADACVAVTDDFPCFMIPAMVGAAAQQVACRLEAVDSNGLLPMREAPRVFARAVDFRRHLQRTLAPWLEQPPLADPLAGGLPVAAPSLPARLGERWPMGVDADLAALPIDHGVPPARIRGGAGAGERRLEAFLDERLAKYPEDRSQPEIDGTSGLSPYLHFGHLSVHCILDAIAGREGWSAARVAEKATGSRNGWWGMSAGAEAWLDELVTWRELGFNFCSRRPGDYDHYESLPGWARATLEAHAGDERAHVYPLEALEQARTHDPLWNAAQTQMVRDGWFHNAMRMLWGKKILEWSAHPRDALKAMIHLMNKYSLDGRDPSSYTGYMWTLGRYDRPWGPERPIFGAVRYMSSENAARKLRVRGYTKQYGHGSGSLF